MITTPLSCSRRVPVCAVSHWVRMFKSDLYNDETRHSLDASCTQIPAPYATEQAGWSRLSRLPGEPKWPDYWLCHCTLVDWLHKSYTRSKPWQFVHSGLSSWFSTMYHNSVMNMINEWIVFLILIQHRRMLPRKVFIWCWNDYVWHEMECGSSEQLAGLDTALHKTIPLLFHLLN